MSAKRVVGGWCRSNIGALPGWLLRIDGRGAQGNRESDARRMTPESIGVRRGGGGTRSRPGAGPWAWRCALDRRCVMPSCDCAAVSGQSRVRGVPFFCVQRDATAFKRNLSVPIAAPAW